VRLGNNYGLFLTNSLKIIKTDISCTVLIRYFNEEKFIKKHEALLPIIFFYVLIWILNFIAPGILVMELYLIILLVLIIRGLNHYFGWIKILKKD